MVIAYHGCDAAVAEQLLQGEKFRKSRNDYDWLGEGVYFWEYGAARALEFARDQARRGKLSRPAVVGALVQLGRCFDLMDTRFTSSSTTRSLLRHGIEPGAVAPQDYVERRRRYTSRARLVVDEKVDQLAAQEPGDICRVPHKRLPLLQQLACAPYFRRHHDAARVLRRRNGREAPRG